MYKCAYKFTKLSVLLNYEIYQINFQLKLF